MPQGNRGPWNTEKLWLPQWEGQAAYIVPPLANFGNVSFSGASANGALLTGSTPGIDAITMASGSTVKAQPSSISNGSFSVAWKHS